MINSSKLFRYLLFIFMIIAVSFPFKQLSAKDRPNVILIYVDDLGYGDPGCYGGTDIQTPNIDNLAQQGIRFTDAHVTCAVCGPSRLGLLTGIYQQRLGCYWNNDLWAQHEWDLPDNVEVIPEMMKKAGYITGHIGKWNISEKAQPYVDEAYDVMLWKGAYYPDENGIYKGLNTGDFKTEPHGWGPPYEGAEYLTDRLTRRATTFIEKHQEKPFFLYLAYNAPHTPLQADRKYNDIYSHLNPEPYRIYAGMVSSLDENIGKMMAKLKKLKLDKNTLVIFASDNGPAKGAKYLRGWHENWPSTLLGSTGGLNGQKASRYEGGHRIPFIISWPEKLKKGKTYSKLTSTLDIYPTILKAAGIDASPVQKLEGYNLLPFIQNKNKEAPHNILFWMNHQQAAIRKGDWKLITQRNGRVTLYNLKNDLVEKQDISNEHPEKVEELMKVLKEWDDELPPNMTKKEKFKLDQFLN